MDPMVLAGGCVAAAVLTYWFFGWRTARRWNTLLRRAGRAADDEVVHSSTLKLPLFVLSGAHREFNDARLSGLVTATRRSMAVAFLLFAVVLWSLFVGRTAGQ
jgi:hypothetical protein